jgi:hypothetical protein
MFIGEVHEWEIIKHSMLGETIVEVPQQGVLVEMTQG